jgi:organic radical activating enzyme
MAKFYKKKNESFLEYRKRINDRISPSFCAAKWYNATVWLNEGKTSSCHHPTQHSIPKKELINNPSALHNTSFKKQRRKEMLEGTRPDECEYCWKVEDISKDHISDRVYKTAIYDESEISECKSKFGWESNVPLKTLEISFDSNCNFACSYCSPTYSTTWQNDVRNNGVYKISEDHDNNSMSKFGESDIEDIYLDSFWKWWESELQYSLNELRITGGEPTASKHFWKLVDWWKDNNPNIDFAVNSNLGNVKQTNKLIEASHYFDNFILYTSNESFGSHSEYIRDGLIWKNWLSNLENFIKNGKTYSIAMMMTINALSLFSLLDFMDLMLELKNKYNTISPGCSFNILRHPSFQSVLVLPKELRFKFADDIDKWVEKNWNGSKNYFMEWERNDMIRLSDYLKYNELENREVSFLNFKNFYKQ